MQPPFARSIAFSFGKLRMFKTVPAAAARVRLDMSMMEVEMRGHARGFSDVLTVVSTRIIYHFRVSTDRNMLSAELLAVRITDSLHDLVLRRRMILAAEPTVYSIVPQGVCPECGSVTVKLSVRCAAKIPVRLAYLLVGCSR
jgi:hypothetical protein